MAKNISHTSTAEKTYIWKTELRILVLETSSKLTGTQECLKGLARGQRRTNHAHVRH
jgi:predicted proteasome-type protease